MFKEPRGKFYFRVNTLEKALLEEKAKQYGYKDVGTYIRDSSIYENIYIEEIDGKKEVLEKADELIESVKILTSKIEDYRKSRLSTYETISLSEEIKEKQDAIFKMLFNIKEVINDKLFMSDKKKYFKIETILEKED